MSDTYYIDVRFDRSAGDDFEYIKDPATNELHKDRKKLRDARAA